MTTSRYLVTEPNVAKGSFLDLSIDGRGLADAVREVIYHGGTNTIEAVYTRAGVTLDFAAYVGTGIRTVFLDGNLSDYSVDLSSAGRIKLIKNSDDTPITPSFSQTTSAPPTTGGGDGGTTPPVMTEKQIKIEKILNDIRSKETFSNPNNPGQIIGGLNKDALPSEHLTYNTNETAGSLAGLTTYSGDGRATPGAFQVDVEILHNRFGLMGSGSISGLPQGAPGAKEILFTASVLSKYLGVEVSADGSITSISKEAYAVFTGNHAIALLADSAYNPTNNALIGQNISNFKSEQFSFYLAGRLPDDSTLGVDSMQNTTRVVPDNIAAMAAKLQYDVAAAYLATQFDVALVNNANNTVDFGSNGFKAVTDLFGTTMRITSHNKAFGVEKGDTFYAELNAGFLAGYGYVVGFYGLRNVLKALVTAKDSGNPQTLTFATGGVGGSPKDVTFTYNATDDYFSISETPMNVNDSFPSGFHYGAIMSRNELPGVSYDDWGVDRTHWAATNDGTLQLGYTSNTVVNITSTSASLTGNGISAVGSYTVNYTALEHNGTVTIAGNDTFVLDSVATAADTSKVDLTKIEQTKEIETWIEFEAHLYYRQWVTDQFVSWAYDAPPPVGVNTASGAAIQLIYAPTGPSSWPLSIVYESKFPITLPTADDFVFANHAPVTGDKLVIDASDHTGSLIIKADSNISEVKLGTGSSQVRDTNTTQTTFTLNANMASSDIYTVDIQGFDLGAQGDVLNLASFTGLDPSSISLTLIALDTQSDKPNSPNAALYENYHYSVSLKFGRHINGEDVFYSVSLGIVSDTAAPTAETLLQNLLAHNITLPPANQQGSVNMDSTLTEVTISVAFGKTLIIDTSNGAPTLEVLINGVWKSATLLNEQISPSGNNSLHFKYSKTTIETEHDHNIIDFRFATNGASFTDTTGDAVQIGGDSGTSSPLESVLAKINADTTLVFANGSVTTQALANAVNGNVQPTLDSSNRSVDLNPQKLDGTSQTVRVIQLDKEGDTSGEVMAIARKGTTYNVRGHTGVDILYVDQGAKVNATILGAGKDRIYFAGKWSDYTKTISGLTVTFTDAFGGYVVLSMSQGANQDELVFEDGMVGSLNVIDALRENPAAVFTDVVDNVDTVKTVTYVPSTLTASNLVLTDTGASATDNITKSGTLNISRAAGELTDTLEYRVKGADGQWGDWATADLNQGKFTIAGQASGLYGQVYEAGSIEMRQVSSAGKAGESVLNADKILVDNATGQVSAEFSSVVSHVAKVTPGQNGGIGFSLGASFTGWTIGFWANGLDTLQSTDVLVGFGGPTSTPALYANGGTNMGTTVNYAPGITLSKPGWVYVVVSATSAGALSTYVDGKLWTVNSATPFAVDVNYISLLGQSWSGYKVSTTVNASVADVKILSSTVATETQAAALKTQNSGLFAQSTFADGFSMNRGGQVVAVESRGATMQEIPTVSGLSSALEGSSSNPILSGAGAELDAKITVTAQLGSGTPFEVTGTQNISADGTWSFTPTNLSTAGTYTLTIKQVDKAGNETTTSGQVRIVPEYPGTPDLAAASDLGVSDSDNLTAASLPTVSGTFKTGTVAAASFALSVSVNGTETLLSTSGSQGLTFNTAAGTWSYTPATAYKDGDVVTFTVRAYGVDSAPLVVTIDSVAANTTLTEPAAIPEILQTSSFDDDGNLTLAGTAEAGSTAVKLIFTDKNGVKVNVDATVLTSMDGLTTTWSTVLKPAQFSALADGAATLSVEATSLSGAKGVLQVNPNFMLELANTAPEANDAVDTVTAFATTGLIVDLLDIFGTADPKVAYFVDADLPESDNATLTYSAQWRSAAGDDGEFGTADDVFSDLPSWLELTPTGQVRVVDGETPLNGTYQLKVTATDGAGATASRTLVVEVSNGPLIALDENLSDKALDLRSDLLLNASANVTLVAEAEGAGKLITLVNTADATRNIVLDMGNADDRAMITIEGGKIRINPAVDLDLGVKYRVEVAGGIFLDEDGNGSRPMGLVQHVGFDTVGVKAAGVASVGHLYDASGDLQAVNWFDLADRGGLSGDYNDWSDDVRATALDAGTGASVFYAGAAAYKGNLPVTDKTFWALLDNFGNDDFIYLDDLRSLAQGYGSANVVEGVGLGSFGDEVVEGNSLYISTASSLSSGARIDVRFDNTTKASLPGGHLESWSDATRAPSFEGVFGHVPVIAA